MNNDWIEFNEHAPTQKAAKPRVLLTKAKVFRLNGKALELIGRPEAVRFLYDVGRHRIGIRPGEPGADFSFPMREERKGGARKVSAAGFCKRFGIPAPESSLEFQSVRVDDEGTLILDLKSTKSVPR